MSTTTDLARKFRDAMIHQHDAVGHALEVHVFGTDDCQPCRQAAEECDGEKACDRWRAWQAEFEAALSLPLDAAPTTFRLPEPGPEVTELWDGHGGRVERSFGRFGGWWYRGMTWRWLPLLEKAGPLSTVPPEQTERFAIVRHHHHNVAGGHHTATRRPDHPREHQR